MRVWREPSPFSGRVLELPGHKHSRRLTEFLVSHTVPTNKKKSSSAGAQRKKSAQLPKRQVTKVVRVVEKAPPRRQRSVVRPRSYKSELATGLRTLGAGVGGAISDIFGFGDYHVRYNTLVHPSRTDQAPNFGSGNGSVRIRHREYLGEVFGSILFNITAYNLNPADSVTFPWLSNIAVNFEQWCPHGLVFDFRSMSSETQISTATTALGTIILGTEYNALASRFTSKQNMEASQFAVSVKPSVSVLHPVECDISQTPSQPLYVRLPGLSPVNADPRLYDLGRFQIASQGMTVNGGDQGELWVTYDIEFMKPILQDDEKVVDFVRSAHFKSSNPYPTALSPGANYDVFRLAPETLFDNFGTGIVFVPGSLGGVNVAFPIGTFGLFKIDLFFDCTQVQNILTYVNPPATIGTPAPVFIAVSNITPVSFDSGASSQHSPSSSSPVGTIVAPAGSLSASFLFRISSPTVVAILQIYFGIDGGGNPTVPYGGNTLSPVSVELICSQIDSAFV